MLPLSPTYVYPREHPEDKQAPRPPPKHLPNSDPVTNQTNKQTGIVRDLHNVNRRANLLPYLLISIRLLGYRPSSIDLSEARPLSPVSPAGAVVL